METPKYLQILWAYKWLLVFGLLVAIVAGFFAGYTIRDGQVLSRATQTWYASTTVLVDSGNSTLYQSEIYPPVPTADETVVPEVITQDLTDLAQIYAYLASSAEIEDRVEGEIGELSDLEQITAVSRTTQPSGNERFPGRLSLPIIDILGIAPTADRAEELSRAANEQFQAYLTEQQNKQELRDDIRVTLTTLEEQDAEQDQGSNPAIPVVVAGGGTFLAFVALAFILYGARSGARGRAEARSADAQGPDDTVVES